MTRDRDPQVEIVGRRLGASTAKLYADVLVLFEVATRGATPTRAALRALVIDLLCGAYHDFKSEAPLPKGDLVEALRAIPRDPPADAVIARMIGATLRGEYDEGDDEAKRWADRLLADNVRAQVVFKAKTVDARTVNLTPREGQVFTWLTRYIDCYGRPPLVRELAEALTMSSGLACQLLGLLEAKGVVANIGGRRPWITTRQP